KKESATLNFFRNALGGSALSGRGGDPRAPRPRRRLNFCPGQTFLPKSDRGRFLSGPRFLPRADPEPPPPRRRCRLEPSHEKERAHGTSRRERELERGQGAGVSGCCGKQGLHRLPS